MADPSSPVHAAAVSDRPERPTGPILVVMNARSGADDKQAWWRRVEAVLRPLGRPLERLPLDAGPGLPRACHEAARRLRDQDGLLVAAGGDGTVNAVAHLCHQLDVPLGVLPLGTFNYFARFHGIPVEPEAAARVIADGRLRTVNLGEVNGRLFLNNASFGLYTRWIEQRERAKARFGRFRAIVLLSGMAALLQGQRGFAIRIVDRDQAAPLRTSLVFVGNNTLQLEGLKLDAAACTRANALGVLVLRPAPLAARLRLLLRAAFGDPDDDERLECFCSTQFEVQSGRARIRLVIDGELVTAQTPLRFRLLPAALRLLVPSAGGPA